jgi:phage-related protein
MQEEPFVSSTEILEETVRGRDRPYFQGIKKNPLKFSVNFAFMDTFDNDKINEITRWLTGQEYYQELYFTNELGVNPEKIYYALVVEDSNLVHNCLRQGYITLTFRCDSPNAYSPIYFPNEFKWTETPSLTTINTFSGEHLNTQVVNNKLQLTSTKPKWSDLPDHFTWADLA